MGSGIHMIDAGFQVEEGVHQRAVPSGYLYSLNQNRAVRNHRERVEACRRRWRGLGKCIEQSLPQ